LGHRTIHFHPALQLELTRAAKRTKKISSSLIETASRARISHMCRRFELNDQSLGTRERPGGSIPEDLREWISGHTLLQMAQRAAQEHTVSTLRPVFVLTPPQFHHPWRLLSLLTFAYGCGVLHSDDVFELAALSPQFFELLHGRTPNPEVISRFREQNMSPLTGCLESLLRKAWREQFGSGPGALHPLLEAEIVVSASSRIQRARAMDRASGLAATPH
jgi:hypothetical protein